jgi:hypothetical protein
MSIAEHPKRSLPRELSCLCYKEVAVAAAVVVVEAPAE